MLFLPLIVSFAAVAAANPVRPVIAIVTAPVSVEANGSSNGGTYPGKYYFAASYVKFVEAHGGRAVPIVFDITDEELIELHSRVNGILIPGGGASLDHGEPYRVLLDKIYNLTITAFENGRSVPLWGTCLGSEAIAVVASNNDKILTQFDSDNITLPMDFSPADADPSSRLFGAGTPPAVKQIFAMGSSFNNHRWGVSPGDFDTQLRTNGYRALAYSNDRNGKPFVAAFEHTRYPVYAVQFHPEKPLFEWDPFLAIPHDGNAIQANSFLSSFLLDAARQNSQNFDGAGTWLAKNLIYNFAPFYTGRDRAADLGIFEQCYFFNPRN